MTKPKVAIVHDSLTQHGGGEKTVEAICEIFPNAPIYTSVYKPKKMSGFFKNKKVITANSNLNKVLGKIPTLSKYFTFLLPLIFENFDLSEFDIIISSSSSYAKGVLTTPEQLHIGYIHTPPRFLYGYSVESTKRDAWYYKPVVMVVDHYLRTWDFLAAQRPDYLVTNSKNVQKRISKFYKRDSKVIYPPVEVEYAEKESKCNNMEQPYYVALGRLSAYKNFDLIINAFNLLGMPLKIIGTGTEEANLKKIAKDNIEFLGRIPDKEKHCVLQHCLGYLFPVEEEDLGITVIEALAHGKPVLAHRSGGPLEIIRENKDGMFFDSLDLDHFVKKLKEFDKKIRAGEFDFKGSKKYAKKFSQKRFNMEFEKFVMEKWKEKNAPTQTNHA
jgi:glycosyltransferase involved in cell wall biosynthesis